LALTYKKTRPTSESSRWSRSMSRYWGMSSRTLGMARLAKKE